MPSGLSPIPRLAFTIAIGPEAVRQARLLRATFKAAHPDIPFLLVDGPLYARLTLQPGVAHAGEIMTMRAVIGRYLSRHAARIAYFDADILIFAPLPHFFPENEVGAPGVVLTGDFGHSASVGMTFPLVNAGALSASDPRFWWLWTHLIEGRLLPLVGNFFDQYALRLMASVGTPDWTVPCTVLPEAAERDYYNVGAFDAPGEWRREGSALHKGEARVRLWHWAGYGTKPGIEALPAPAQDLLRERMREGHRNESATLAADHALFEALFIDALLLPFYEERTAELSKIATLTLDGTVPTSFGKAATIQPPDDLWGTDVPAVWDTLRPLPEGFHRRLLPNGPRYLYARSEERLHAPDVERYDRALWSGA
ncbi:hypothetical protein SAMN05444156_1222 [Verrucomicrobium sp. GAS474]|uniref:hypothetical protein n=1 Tax=Verrucomicrobium sp. GAS474 TaxID=1882831 RepID=UPI00087C328F|nr:hypothetical protein [Verrucomicrobium sp. GAS474]SDT97984.1 hypothetical protein SAMN05444156_1222 [Verrucomicrobium sp. GAS474]